MDTHEALLGLASLPDEVAQASSLQFCIPKPDGGFVIVAVKDIVQVCRDIIASSEEVSNNG